jgi:hypothetical protein
METGSWNPLLEQEPQEQERWGPSQLAGQPGVGDNVGDDFENNISNGAGDDAGDDAGNAVSNGVGNGVSNSISKNAGNGGRSAVTINGITNTKKKEKQSLRNIGMMDSQWMSKWVACKRLELEASTRLNQSVEAWKKAGCAEGSLTMKRLRTALKEMWQW